MFGRRITALLTSITVMVAMGIAALAQEAPPSPELITTVPKTLSLDEAIVIALRNNPTVEIANQEIRANRGQVTQAASAALPQVSAAISRTTPVNVPTDSFQSVRTTWETDVTLTQPLYTWGAIGQGIRAARLLLSSAQSSYLRAQDQIAFFTRQAYYRVLTAIESVRVQQDVLAAAEEHRRIAGIDQRGQPASL